MICLEIRSAALTVKRKIKNTYRQTYKSFELHCEMFY